MSDRCVNARRSRGREALIGLAMTLASVGVTLFGAEIAVRLISARADLWELRNYVAVPPKLEEVSGAMMPDPLLGHVPNPGYSRTLRDGTRLTFDHHGLRAHRVGHPPPLHALPPIMVVGDSFAMGMEVTDDETWPAHLEALLDRRVLNGAVRGYGIDQIVLRAERLVPVHRPGLLLVGFIADDVRRAEQRILWGVEKPYFDVVDGGLILRNVPVEPPEESYDEPLDPVRRVLGYSYLLELVTRRLGLSTYWHRGQPARREQVHDQGGRVACLLMDRLRQLGQAHGMQIVVVAQYSDEPWRLRRSHDYERAVAAEVLACARSAGLKTVDTYVAVATAVRAHGMSSYYIDKHMNDRGNRLTAAVVAQHIRE